MNFLAWYKHYWFPHCQDTSAGKSIWKRQVLLLRLLLASDRFDHNIINSKTSFCHFLLLKDCQPYSLYFTHLKHAEPHTSSQWVQGGDEAGGPRPTEHHLHLHRHSRGPDRLQTPPALGWVRQQERLLAAGGFLWDPANRKLWEEWRHAAATPW